MITCNTIMCDTSLHEIYRSECIFQNKTVRNAQHGDDAIQIAPQELTIKLRPSKATSAQPK